MKLYLAHPFDTRYWIREWELGFETRTGITLNNPFYDAPDRFDVEQIDAGRAERYNKLEPISLVHHDLAFLSASDGLLGIIDGSISYGTIMEIVYARILRLPVYLIVTNGHHQHPWLIQHSDRIFTSLESCETYFKETA